jgi:type I restriction enzyme M protein
MSDDLALWIKTQRKQRNLTQANLAAQLGTTQASVSQWENGKTPSLADYERLRALLAEDPAAAPTLQAAAPKKLGRPPGSTNKPRQASLLAPDPSEDDTTRDELDDALDALGADDKVPNPFLPKPPAPRRKAVKKSDLYSSLWASCDALRGGMDASLYKDYVLFMLFIKYISDRYANQEGFPEIEIPKGATFDDMVKLKNKDEIGDKINKHIIQPLIDANPKLSRSDFPDFNDANKLGDGKEMVDRLSNLIAIFERPELNFSSNRAADDDLLGDAYEYLMRHFATESGKSKGQFYTPSEVSRVIAKVIGASPDDNKGSKSVHDPTCGSGSLLLKVAAEVGKHIQLEGQEKDVTTAGLARMNMILHGFATAEIKAGNTLASPKFTDDGRLRTYDYVVANPPFSDKAWATGLDVIGDEPQPDEYQRFEWAVPPAKQGDYAYLLHIVRAMKPTGKAACILPHGVLFRGNAEATIRKKLVESGILKAIIGLPPNLFYGTGIPACILVLDKENAAARAGVFMIDASKGFAKDGPKNRLRERDIHQIVDAFKHRRDLPRYARMVPLRELSDPKNDYNLNLPRYIDSSEPEDLQDLEAHLKGGIPARDVFDALAPYWEPMPDLRAALFEELRPHYLRLRVSPDDLKPTLQAHPQLQAFRARVLGAFDAWKARHEPAMRALNADSDPKRFLTDLAEDLLHTFEPVPLVDAYELYQRLMEYADATMRDDLESLKADGWVAHTARIIELDKKDKPKDKGWVCDLVPKPLLVARHYAKFQADLDDKQAKLDELAAQMAEIEDEHTAEGGAMEGLEKVNKALVTDLLREVRDNPEAQDEAEVLQRWLHLCAQETKLKRAYKDVDAKLDALALARYPKLTEAEVQTLVITDKWLPHLEQAVHAELDRTIQALITRLRDLADRYATPLPELEADVARLSARVAQHLKQMGVSWN